MGASSLQWQPGHFVKRLWEAVQMNWYLGFTAFGGPPVHFKIFHDKYVKKLGWIDEPMYQEIFAVCQALSGPASTKMLYCINLIHLGFLPAVLSLFIWSLPGAIGMFGLAIGVSHIGETLPRAAFAVLSGLNAAVVGVILLAAVELAHKAITDRLTRILVFLGATAGMMYNSLWYYPLLMFLAGVASVVFDYKVFHPIVKWVGGKVLKKKVGNVEEEGVELPSTNPTPNQPSNESQKSLPQTTTTNAAPSTPPQEDPPSTSQTQQEPEEPRIIPTARVLKITWQFGTLILILFLLSFITLMVLRGVISHKPLLFSLFTNLYLAGTIIFGGGPVVVPLLRSYVVTPGWVTPRDFLLGLAIIQAFPGPNFNFAVYLGGLTAYYAGYNILLGAVLGYVGIFAPGIIMVHGTMGIWSALRGKRWVKSCLRGINAAAVGLIYTAVYKLWQIGFVDQGFENGKSLGDDPWWVVVGSTSFVGGRWFGVSAPVGIVLGAVMGLVRYGVVVG